MRRRCLHHRGTLTPRLRLVSSNAAGDAERAADSFIASMPQTDLVGLRVARDAYVLGWLECLEHLERKER